MFSYNCIARYCFLVYLLAIGLLWGAIPVSSVQEDTDIALTSETPSMSMALKEELSEVAPNASFWVAAEFKLQPTWHVAWMDPLQRDMSLKLVWQLPEGFQLVEELWPPSALLDGGGVACYGYDKPFTILAKIATPNKSGKCEVGLQAHWVTCSEVMCLPGSDTSSVAVSLEANGGKLVAEHAPLFAAARKTLLPSSNEEELLAYADLAADIEEEEGGRAAVANASALLLALAGAFLGGLCLNMMPCVLPVISLKVLSFVKMAGESRRCALQHGIAFSLGILLSFWLLAGAMFALQASGSSVGWGFQLQEPLFVGGLAALLLLLGLNLFGVFEIGTFFAAWVGTRAAATAAVAPRSRWLGSFGSGVLATAVAAPCTGPFLGSAVGLAVTLPWLQGLAIFTALGCGMASPYLLLSAYPQFLRFIPKPGAWMETFKQLMGFMMLAAVVWLIWVFGAQTSSMSISLLLTGLLLLALGVWIYGKWGTPWHAKGIRLASLAATLLLLFFAIKCIATGAAAPLSDRHEAIAASWEPFDPLRVEELRRQGKPVFIDFTAKWCLICQANHLILSSKSVAEELDARGVVKMKADWTRRDPIITLWLQRYGRSGVPLYLYFDARGQEAILPQLLTPQVVLQAVSVNDAAR